MKVCDTCHSTYPTDFSSCPKDQSPLRLATELMQGMIVRDKYEIVGKIGAGGMATVYRARHLVFNEPRAIKLVSSRMMDDENFLKRFRNEAVITRKLQHPNAVRVDDIDTTEDGRPCMIMELVEGRNLRATIEQQGALPLDRALNIARQAASALAAAHRLGITHRDIKPDNIVLVPLPDGKDMVKVLDFGIAKLRETSGGGGAYTATQTGMVIGTPQYISPEQAAGKRGEEIDGRADLYSLGVVLYEMVTGRLPFESDTPMGLLLQHMQAAPRPPQEIRPDLDIPEPVSALLMKCLEKEPGKRFQSAEELISALQQPEGWGARGSAQTTVMGSDEYPAPSAAATTRTQAATAAVAAAPARAPQPPPRSGPAKWIAAVVVLAVALGVGYVVLGKRTASTATASPTVSAPPSPAMPSSSMGQPSAHVEPAAATSEAPPDPAKPQPDARARELLVSGRRHMDSGEYDQAIRDLQKALQIEPGNAAAQNELKRAQQAKRTEEQVLGRKR